MQNFQPRTQQQDERLITVEQKSFASGAFNDIPASRIPKDGVKYLCNYVVTPDNSLMTRTGTARWSNVKLPAIPGKTGLTVSKSGTTITMDGIFETADIGRYMVYDDNTRDLIIARQISSGIATAETNVLREASVAAYIQGAFCGWHYHAGKDRIVIHLDKYFYISDGALTAWVRVIPLGNYYPQANSPTRFQEVNNKVIAFNKNGIFCIDLDYQPDAYYTTVNQYCFYKLNSEIPSVRMRDQIADASYAYKYRYLYGYARIRGAGYAGDRTTTGAVVDHQSGPINYDVTLGKDYSDAYAPVPIGPGTTFYGTLTGGALTHTINEFAEWDNAQMHFAMDGDTQNVICDFTGITSWNEVAAIVQLALRDWFPAAKVEFYTDYFVVSNYAPSGNISYATTGDGGIDLSAMLHFRSIYSAHVDNAVPMDMPFQANDGNVFNAKQDSSLMPYDHWTHYTLWRTLDIGKAGVDPQTGNGNNTEKYAWVADVPILKVFSATRTWDAGESNYLITSDTNVFTKLDVGDTIRCADLTDIVFTITEYSDAKNVVAEFAAGYGTTSKVASEMGCHWNDGGFLKTRVVKAHQNGTTITVTAGIAPTSSDIGKVLYWEDGGISVIAGASGATLTSEWADVHASQAAGHTPTARTFCDTIDDTALRSRGQLAYLNCSNRFWQQIPDATDCGVIANGFMITAARGAKRIYYSQLANGLEYLYGYCNLAEQNILMDDLISNIGAMQSLAIVYCYNSIYTVPLNSPVEQTVNEAGSVVLVLPGKNIASSDTGCVDYASIKDIDGYNQFFVSSDAEARIAKYDGTSIKLTEDLAENRLARTLAKSICMAVSYDKTNGIIMWLRSTPNPVNALAGRVVIENAGITTESSYHYAVAREQGVGFSENSGNDWVSAPCAISNVQVYDIDKLLHCLMICNNDGYVYDMTQREGPVGSAIGLVWKDKVGTTGIGGTEVVPYVIFPEDTGSRENFFLQHKQANFSFRPYDYEKHHSAGYDTNGYSIGLQFQLDMYLDGDLDNTSATVNNITHAGDVVFDKIKRAHRIQIKLTANKGEHYVTGRKNDYEAEDKADAPQNRFTTEMEHQQAFALPSQWIHGWLGNVIDMTNGIVAGGDYDGLSSGTDGATSAIVMAGETGVIGETITMAGDFAFHVRVSNVTQATTVLVSLGALTISMLKSGSAYTLSFTDGTTTATQLTGWDGTGEYGFEISRSGDTLSIYEGVNA